MRKLTTVIAVVGAATAMAAALAAVPKVAQAGHLSCGETLIASTSLDDDLTCASGSGLIIGAKNVVVDLNGYTLTGTELLGFDNVGVDNSGGFDGMKVKNGTIVGFDSAVRVADANKIQLIHLIVSGARKYHAIDMVDSSRLQIKHSSITVTIASPSSTFGFVEGMRLESVDDVKILNVDVHGGFIGVNFACGLCDGSEVPTNGDIRQSTFTGNVIGILIANSTDALVKSNHVSDTVDLQPADNPFGFFTIGSKGISVDSDFGAGNTVSGVVVKENHVHDSESIGIRVKADNASITFDILVEGNLVHDNGSDGILLVDADDSEVTENLVNDNGGRGIALTSDSEGNDITDNGATGNTGFDLLFDETGDGNTWVGNTCGTKSGGEIPAC